MKKILLISSIFLFLACGSNRPGTNGTKEGDKKEQQLGDVVFEGGRGTSMRDAVIISNVKNSYQGIQAEYLFIEKTYGIKNLDWQLISQDLLKANLKQYDIITIRKVADKSEIKLYFDISSFYGKF